MAVEEATAANTRWAYLRRRSTTSEDKDGLGKTAGCGDGKSAELRDERNRERGL